MIYSTITSGVPKAIKTQNLTQWNYSKLFQAITFVLASGYREIYTMMTIWIWTSREDGPKVTHEAEASMVPTEGLPELHT